MYLRIVKVPSTNGSVNEYVRVVESFREGGKVKQRTIADLGRKDLLVQLFPKLQRLLSGQPLIPGEDDNIAVLQASTWGPVLVVRALFRQLGLWGIFDELLGHARKGAPFAEQRKGDIVLYCAIPSISR